MYRFLWKDLCRCVSTTCDCCRSLGLECSNGNYVPCSSRQIDCWMFGGFVVL